MPRDSSSGAGSSRDGKSRKSVTASARRQLVDERRLPHIAEQDIVDDVAEDVPNEAVPESEKSYQPGANGYPGGPTDTSLLISFPDHIAQRVWRGEAERSLKLASHGGSLAKVYIADQIRQVVLDSGLESLSRISYGIVDKGLLGAFIERWHSETSSFHLPVGEMTITLDDVSQLLHLPVRGTFWNPTYANLDTCISDLVDYLGVHPEEARQELTKNSNTNVRLIWLSQEVYPRRLSEGRFEEACRTYLLYLVGSTIFADKSGNRTKVIYLSMFIDLGAVGNYSWGGMTLAYLYDQLREASKAGCAQMAGYMTLLQAWIHEHFTGPMFGTRELDTEYVEGVPRAARWSVSKGTGSVPGFRQALDMLAVEDVTWDPYTGHRDVRPFEPIALYRGFIRFGNNLIPYLPDRVVRQFGTVQGIPQDPRTIRTQPVSPSDVDAMWLEFDRHVIVLGPHAMDPSDTVPGYYGWFRNVSHPWLYECNIPPDSQDVDLQTRAHQIATRMLDGLLNTEPGTEGHGLMRELQRISRPMGGFVQRYVRRRRRDT